MYIFNKKIKYKDDKVILELSELEEEFLEEFADEIRNLK